MNSCASARSSDCESTFIDCQSWSIGQVYDLDLEAAEEVDDLGEGAGCRNTFERGGLDGDVGGVEGTREGGVEIDPFVVDEGLGPHVVAEDVSFAGE